jgi:hypothetical protein
MKTRNIGKEQIAKLFVTMPAKGQRLPEIPGIKISVKEIPTGITLDHDQVYAYWEDSGLKGSELLHIDGHSDMCWANAKEEIQSYPYWKELDIASFIVPAVHYGIVSSVYWLNPHSKEKRLQDMGCIGKNGRLSLDTYLEKTSMLGREVLPYRIQLTRFKDDIANTREGKIVRKLNLNKDKPFILDIDIDAFCCHKLVHNMPAGYDGVKGYVGRLDETMEFLEKLKRKPELITITYSAGQEYNPSSYSSYSHRVSEWCPKEHRKNVMERTINGLKEIY